jgi:hypothetical protein
VTRSARTPRSAVLAVALVLGCHPPDPVSPPPGPAGPIGDVSPPVQKGNAMAPQDVVNLLNETSYQRLFMAMSDQPIDDAWTRAGGAAGLDAVIGDAHAPAHPRLLAAELRWRKDPGFRPADPASLARAYAEALRGETLANPWGMPGELDEPLGRHVVALGEPAVAALIPLLADGHRIDYGGSKEATVGNEYEMRVKDFAAFFIAKIRNRPLTLDTDPKRRDQVIADLRASL